MLNFVIFLPEFEYKKWKGYLYGTVFSSLAGIAIYVHGNECDSNCEYSSYYERIGEVCSGKSYTSRENWLFIEIINNHIKGISVQSKELNCVTVVLYNRNHIKDSQWLNNIQFPEIDLISRLIREVKEEPIICCKILNLSAEEKLSYFIGNWLSALKKGVACLNNCRLLRAAFRISSFGTHFMNVTESFLLISNHCISENKLNVAYKNYISARILDALLGQIIIFYVMSCTSPDEMFLALTKLQEYAIMYLKDMVTWLTGSPAGFKLNSPLNNILGPFYQFHISLWWTFLGMANPFLKVLFNLLLLFGNFGFSFQVAILADLLAIVSVHMYCIYVYAAKLYCLQINGLKILSRLFIGKKREPLPGTEYSPPYTTEQLLFGTVSFTVLLFLLPTTLIYYLVFTTIRIFLIFIGGIFTRLRHFINIFPVYITWLWFYRPVVLTYTIRLSNKMKYLSDGTLVIKLKPVCESWWKTVTMNIPESIRQPNDIEWRKLTTWVLNGNLIYPV